MAMNEIASLYAKVGADVSDFMRNMDKVKEETGAFGKTAGLVASGTKLAMGAGVAAIGALAGGIGYATTQAMDMEQAIANITATMGLSATQTEELKGLITDLGLDPKLKVSATEAAAAIDMLGKNGLTMDQIMGGAAKSAVLLANATNDDFAMAADVATDVMAQFNIGADGMNAAIDQIIGVTQASKFTLDDYALAIAQAGGVAGSVGVGFVDFNAVIAATSSSFASGSDAGTSFKTFLQRLVPQTKDAETMMMHLGLMTAEGGNAFFDATGKMKPMEEIAGLLQTAFAGLSEEQRINAASTLFGTDAMRTGLALAEAGTETIQKYKTTIGNVSAEQAAATRMDTLRGSWEVFQGILETLTLSIGNAFLPLARKLVEWVSSMASKYGPQLVDWAGRFADKLAGVVTWLSQSGDYLTDLYDGIVSVVKPIIEIIGHFVSWQDVLGAFVILLGSVVVPAIVGFVTAAAPVIGVIAALVAAVAIMRKAWESNWGGIRDVVGAIYNYLAETFGGLFRAIKQFGAGALQEISDWVQGNKTSFENLKAIWAALKEATVKLWNDLVGFVKESWPKWVEALGKWGVAAWQWIVDVTPKVISQLSIWLGQLWNWIVANTPGWARKLGEWAVQLWQWIVDVTPKAISKLAEWTKALWNWLVDNVPGWARRLLDAGVDMMQGLWDGIKQKWEDIKRWASDTFTGWINWIKGKFGIASPSKVFLGFGRNIMEGMALGLEDELPAVNTQLNVLGSNVTAAGADVQNGGSDNSSLETVLLRLASAIERNGLGNKINVNMQGNGDMRSDLAPTVSYLTALYGTA